MGGPIDSRIRVLDLLLSALAALGLWRLAFSRLATRAVSAADIVVIGAGWAGRTLQDAIDARAQANYRLRAFVDDDPGLQGTSLNGIPIHSSSDLAHLVYAFGRRARVVLALGSEAHAELYKQLTGVAQRGIEVVSMAAVYEEITGRIPVRHLGDWWWAALPRPSADTIYLAAKRLLDITFGLAGLLALALLLPVVAPLLKREAPGPVFFRQARIGRYGRIFKVVKLRTLPNHQAAAFVDHWERKNANRPGPVGAFLRATGIDELPQCFNVLKGEMSLVGPRPYILDEVSDFEQQIPFFQTRALVKPGLTGWAQVNWGYGFTIHDEVEKLQYDLYYVGHQSFYLDLLILFRTARLLLRRRRSMPMMADAPPDAVLEHIEQLTQRVAR